jgi:hypothetical protein
MSDLEKIADVNTLLLTILMLLMCSGFAFLMYQNVQLSKQVCESNKVVSYTQFEAPVTLGGKGK